MSDETSPLLCSEDAENNDASYSGLNGITTNVEDSGKSYLAFIIPMSIGIFLAAMDEAIMVSSYAAIGSDLKHLQNTSWIATAYMLTTTSFQPLYGKLSDIFGRKSCLLFTYAIFAIGSLLCGLSRNMSELIASRALSGIGGGGMQTIVSIIVTDVVPLRSRGTWQGVLNIVWTMGSVCGAPLGGFLADNMGWRWAFLTEVPLTILAILSVIFGLHLPTTDTSDFYHKRKRIDFAGSLSLIIAVFGLLFGLDRGGNISWNDNLTLISLGSSLTFFVLFGIIEMGLASEPFAPKRIIFNQSLIAGYLANFFSNAAGMSLVFHVSLYLQAVQGKSASEAAMWLLLNATGGLVGSLTGGLAIQATGKFYLLTVVAYTAQFVGMGLINLSTRTLLHSMTALGVGFWKCGATTSLIALIANVRSADQAIATGGSFLPIPIPSYLRRNLSGTDVEEIIVCVQESLSYIGRFDPVTKAVVNAAYAHAVRVTLTFTVVMAAFAAISSVFIKETLLTRR